MKGKSNMKNMKKILASSLVLTLALTPISTLALSKEETVYAKLNSDGSVKSILVNEHLINNEKLDSIEDYSELEDILNINSNHTYTKKDNLLTWDSKGSDIFYQGISKKETPVTENITYKLNGEDISLNDLIGKSGKVEITIKYNNTDKHVINKQTLYTPFVVTTATIVDGANNSDITVTNGKVVNNGSNFIVVGLSTPGLYESLGLQELKGLDTVKISYNTTKFKLSSIYSVVTSKLIDNNDLDIFSKLNTVYSSVNKLQDSMNQIESGSKTILENLKTIDEGSSLISENLNTVVEKLEQIKEGSASLDTNLEQIITTLDNVIASFNSSENQAKIESIKTLIATNTNTITKLTEGNANSKLAYENYHLDMLTYAQVEAMSSDLVSAKYNFENNYDMNNNLIYLLTKNNEALTSSLETLNSIQSQITTLDGYLKQMKTGTNTLKDGTSMLYSGVSVLNTKMKELSDGTSKLQNGMNTLNTGITTFNQQGINTLSNLATKANSISSKASTLMKLGEEYQTFDTKGENVESSTKFVLVVDGVKAKEEQKQVVKETKKVSFIDRIKNLFK